MSDGDELEPGAVDAGGGETEPQQPAAAPEDPGPAEAGAPPAPRAPGIAYNHRVLCLGMTQSGKSELLNHLFSSIRAQRLLIDYKDEFSVPDTAPVRAAAAIDWTQPIIHYVPDPRLGLKQFEELFAICNQRTHLVVAHHELGALCNMNPSATPPSALAYMTQGASKGRGFLGGSQRPSCFPVACGTEAEHVFIFVPGFTGDDLRTLAKFVNRDWRELDRLITDAHRAGGDHTYLWFDRWTRELRPYKPLPERVRARTVVQRRQLP